jgi:hypothetical protein
MVGTRGFHVSSKSLLRPHQRVPEESVEQDPACDVSKVGVANVDARVPLNWAISIHRRFS